MRDDAALGPNAPLARTDGRPAGWAVSSGLVDYPDALAAMEARAEAIRAGEADELVWLLEHPPLYTSGTSAQASDLLNPRFPVYAAGRGGQYTYHGPGQRVVYLMLDLTQRGRDVRAFVHGLEGWLIDTVAQLGVEAFTRDGRVGVWTPRPSGPDGVDDKLAAIGVRLRRWVSFHGIALNVAPDLSHYAGIVPCGVRDHGVTSLKALGARSDMADVDAALKTTFEARLGATLAAAPPA